MSCQDTTELLMDRLKGHLSAADEQRLAAHLATCADCRTEAAMVTSAWDQLGALDEEVPHERLRARFHAGLAAYEARESRHWMERFLGRWWPKQPALQFGLAAALAVVGVMVGRSCRRPSTPRSRPCATEVRTVGLALLDHQSASERLLGVEWSQRTAQTPEIVNALLERVQYDPNLSVRLAAVDALRSGLERPGVSDGPCTRSREPRIAARASRGHRRAARVGQRRRHRGRARRSWAAASSTRPCASTCKWL